MIDVEKDAPYPIYNRGYKPLTKWDDPPSMVRGEYVYITYHIYIYR